MTKKRTSYAFLMEMLWVCGFFALAACIFVLAFVKADRLSKDAENLNYAVQISENAVETVFADSAADSAPNETLSGFDRNWNACEADASEAVYFLQVNTHIEGGLLRVTADVSELRGREKRSIYILNGARSLDVGRRLP